MKSGISERETATSADFYVAPEGDDESNGTIEYPFATISRARDAVREMKNECPPRDITVLLRGGRYCISETIVFGTEDSAGDGHTVSYAAYPGEEPIITSGIRIRGWYRLKDYPDSLPEKARGKIWAADLAGQNCGNHRFRTLFDGEKMLPRARSRGYQTATAKIIREKRWENLTTLHFPEGALRDWKNLDDVEIVVRPNHVWVVNYLGLASVDEESGTAETTIPATYAMNRLGERGERANLKNLWVENVLDVLDEPGEWVLDTHECRLYLWPENGTPGEEIYAPRLQELIRIEGANTEKIDGDIPVRGLTFRGLILTCGDRDIWTETDKGIQHDWEMYDKGNALLRFRGAEDCRVDSCVLRNSGGSGIRADLYAKNIRMIGNHLHHLGGTGILLCGYGPGLKDVNRGHLINENQVNHCGRLYTHSVGIFIWQSGENRIFNNCLHHLPYDGIVLSGVRPRFLGVSDRVKWPLPEIIPRSLRENMRTIRWDEVGKPKTAPETMRFAHTRNTLVRDNEFHHVMELLGDGNAIYYSCAGPGNEVRRNLIYKSTHALADIRFDDDQQDAVVAENIIFGNGIHLKHRNDILNNIIIGGGLKIEAETEKGARIERNIFYSIPARRKNMATFYGGRDDIPGSAQKDRHVKYGSGDLEVEFFKPGIDTLLSWIRPDRNFFCCKSEPEKASEFLEKMQVRGYEENGGAGDPAFEDLENADFRLKADSPALEAGIEPINVEHIGLTEDPALPRLLKHPERLR